MRKRTYIGYYKGLHTERDDKRRGRAYFYDIVHSGDGLHIVYTARPKVAWTWWNPVKYAALRRKIESYRNACGREGAML